MPANSARSKSKDPVPAEAAVIIADVDPAAWGGIRFE
jgi:hypothetical protein